MKESEYQKITISTSCMNRNDMLVNTVPTWLQHPVKEILIIDWNSSVPVETTLKEHNITDPRIRIVRINEQEYYKHSMARNVKVDLVQTEWVLSVDADVMVYPKFFETMYLLNGKTYYCLPLKGEMDSRFGTTLFRKQDYINVGGCNINMKGWGYEDLDLADRMIKSGCKHIKFDKDCLYHIPHSDERRVENCEVKCKWESNSRNMYVGSYSPMLNWEHYKEEFDSLVFELEQK